MDRLTETERRFLAECAERRQREHSAAVYIAQRLQSVLTPGTIKKDAGRATAITK
jgi:hypothetical protein